MPSELAKITVNDFGGAPVAEHNMPCPVCGIKHAVLYLNAGIFYPCRQCERGGWTLLRLPRWLSRWWQNRQQFQMRNGRPSRRRRRAADDSV